MELIPETFEKLKCELESLLTTTYNDGRERTPRYFDFDDFLERCGLKEPFKPTHQTKSVGVRAEYDVEETAYHVVFANEQGEFVESELFALLFEPIP